MINLCSKRDCSENFHCSLWLQVVKLLIAEGAEVNEYSKDGMTPLSIAAFWGYSEITTALIKAGYPPYRYLLKGPSFFCLHKMNYVYSADLNATNKGTGWTPVHCAAFQGHGPVLLKLLNEAPDLSIKDNRGRLVSSCAVVIHFSLDYDLFL